MRGSRLQVGGVRGNRHADCIAELADEGARAVRCQCAHAGHNPRPSRDTPQAPATLDVASVESEQE